MSKCGLAAAAAAANAVCLRFRQRAGERLRHEAQMRAARAAKPRVIDVLSCTPWAVHRLIPSQGSIDLCRDIDRDLCCDRVAALFARLH